MEILLFTFGRFFFIFGKNFCFFCRHNQSDTESVSLVGSSYPFCFGVDIDVVPLYYFVWFEI